MIIEKIKKELESGNLNEETLNEIQALESSLTKLKEEKTLLESKNLEIIENRDKVKQINSVFKEALGLEDLTNITVEKVKEKITTKNQNEKSELKNIEAQIVSLKEQYENELKNRDNQLFQKNIDLEILKNGQKINCISPVAMEVVMNELKKNAFIEDNKIVFKNEAGEIVRKDGLAITLSDRIESLKQDENYKGFFIADVQSGSGFKSKPAQGTSNNGSKSPIANRMRERAEKLNKKI